MKEALPFIKWTALAVFFALAIAKYGFGYKEIASFTLIPAGIWIAAGLAMRTRATNTETSNDG